MSGTPVLRCAEVRALEQRAIQTVGIPSIVLMENAGRGIAELMLSLGIRGKVAICCGKGNNGGDGLVVARHLDNRHIPISVMVFGKPAELSPDAAVNYRILTGSGVKVDIHSSGTLDVEAIRADLHDADWIVDALFGTGLSGPLRSPFAELVGLINDSPARVMAADIPSGLDGDTGQPLGPTVRAEHTATLLAWKTGLAQEAAKEWVGQVHLVDIGLPRRLLEGA
jgi:NAD(P)H-hydrate epimerase